MRCWVAVHLVPALLTAVASLCSSVAAQPLLRALESPRVHPQFRIGLSNLWMVRKQ
jgi:hypothetical protein